MCPCAYHTQTPSLSYFLTKVQWTSKMFHVSLRLLHTNTQSVIFSDKSTENFKNFHVSCPREHQYFLMFPQAYFTQTPSVSYFHTTKLKKKGSLQLNFMAHIFWQKDIVFVQLNFIAQNSKEIVISLLGTTHRRPQLYRRDIFWMSTIDCSVSTDQRGSL